MKSTHRAALALLLIPLTGAGAHAQTLYGELGYSPLSLKLAVPVIGLRASAEPTLLRGTLGLQVTDSLALEVLGGFNVRSSSVNNAGGSNSTSARVDQLLGVYISPKLGLGPVELYGRLGMAQSKITFKGLGSGEDRKASYGFGLRLLPTDHLTLSVDHMQYLNSGGASVQGYSLNLGLRF
jgi:Outer membrane protein beta-barrel domain